MNQIKSERTGLEQAESELEFWRDFVHWWETRSGKTTEPRVLEALRTAESRYLEAKALR